MGSICNGRIVFFNAGDVPAVLNIFKENKTNGDIQGSKEKYLESIIRLLEPTFKFSFISSFLRFVEVPVGQRILLWFMQVLRVERSSYIGLRLCLSLNHQERVYAYDGT